MKILDKKLKQLSSLLNRYENDELSLRDLNYLDEEFEEIVNDIRELKENIVNERFLETLEEI